jgi:hypothetical protein
MEKFSGPSSGIRESGDSSHNTNFTIIRFDYPVHGLIMNEATGEHPYR